MNYDETMQTDVERFPDKRGFFHQFPAILNRRYRVSRIVAQGGFGFILEAEDTKVFNRPVLVKAPLFPANLFAVPNNKALTDEVAQAKERMIHERKMLLHGQFRGIAGIPTIIDWFDAPCPAVFGPHHPPSAAAFTNDDPALWDGHQHVVLNFFEGETLDDFCKIKFKSNVGVSPGNNVNSKDKALASCAFFARSIAKALRFFHESKFGLSFVYQDLKPANILVARDGSCQLIDLGSFAVIKDGACIVNAGMGTEGYKAPELERLGAMAVMPRVDVYSLGKTLSVFLQTAFGETTPSPDRMPAGIPQQWSDFLAKCIAQDPGDRFQNMGQIENSLNLLQRKSP